MKFAKLLSKIENAILELGRLIFIEMYRLKKK